MLTSAPVSPKQICRRTLPIGIDHGAARGIECSLPRGILASKIERKKKAMVRADKPVSRKRTILLLVLGLAGFVSLLVGLSWEAVLRAFDTDLARTENFFNLINPRHVSLAHAIVVGIVGLGHFLLVFGVVVMLVGLIGAIYTRLQ